MVEIPLTLFALIGIILAAMFFGYFFGLFEGRGQGYKKRKKEEASDPTLRPVVQPPPPPPAPPVEAAPRTMPPAEKPLLLLTMDAREQPCLEMDGQRIDTTQLSIDDRKRLIELMVVMRPWIDASPVQKPRATGPLSSPAPRPVPSPVPQPAPPPLAPAEPPIAGPAAPPEPVSAPTTMVGQIDAILQSKLIGTPLAGRGIRLVESAQGGAMVVVGLNRYAGVGEVPEPEVQAAIRAAIAEWEKKYTPG